MAPMRSPAPASKSDAAISARRRGLHAPTVGKAALAGLLLVALLTMATVAPVAAATEPITGTATTSGGNGTSTVDFTYSSAGTLGSGTLHFEFVLIPAPPGFRTEGIGVLTRADGATLTGTETSTVDASAPPSAVTVRFTVTSGTGALTGATGEIVLSGTSSAPGATGDEFVMTGSITVPPRAPTDEDQCKHGGWRMLGDGRGAPFRNQGQCVSFVKHAT